MENKKIGVGFGVMMMQQGKVLLGQRHPDPIKADSAMHGEGTWTMPGGKLHFGESFEEGATREVLEETGIKIDPTKLQVVSLTNNRIPDAHFVTIGMYMEVEGTQASVMEPDEITVWDWFDLNKLPSPLFPPSKEVIDNFLAKHIYKHE